MIPQRLIARKRDGGELSARDLRRLLEGYLEGQVGDDQMAAFLMAVFFNGLGARELDVMVDVMLRSGAVLPRGPRADGPRVDKHSTGGVGDKVSIALAPLAAEAGLVVPMMSGRGLGHTGGTLDKLESIPGFETRMSVERFDRVLAQVGCAMIGQTPEIAPLDRRLYALRDVTATVPSLPLITASIMSKKLAESLDGLVLDVKVGRGAFLSGVDRARALARAMVGVGRARGLEVVAVLSAMDRPLGRAVGGALEVREAEACLAGEGPADLADLVVRLAAEMVALGGLEDDADRATAQVRAALEGGGALERLHRLVRAQGGPAATGPGGLAAGLPTAPRTLVVTAERDGRVAGIDPVVLGYALIEMGGGRTRQDQEVDPRVGFELAAQVGDRVARGDPVGVVHAADEDGLRAGERALGRAVAVGEADAPLPLIVDRIAA